MMHVRRCARGYNDSKVTRRAYCMTLTEGSSLTLKTPYCGQAGQVALRTVTMQ